MKIHVEYLKSQSQVDLGKAAWWGWRFWQGSIRRWLRGLYMKPGLSGPSSLVFQLGSTHWLQEATIP